MLKYLVLLAMAFTLNAQEGPKGPPHQQLAVEQQKQPAGRPPRPQLTEEQKKQRAELIAKYDANKDGKLDKEERAKVNEEDRKKLRSFGPPPGGPKGPPRKDGDRPGKPPKKD
jgi:hypothetical protein|tara:strand:- start:362 stop:700 length:339 start_codon:yes stop_codon:yes gene_type:complete